MIAGPDFSSDNASGAAPRVMQAIADANAGFALAYGNDPWTKRLTEAFSALFEAEVAVFPVLTGTAANAIALSAICPPYGAVFCHQLAHIAVDECGAPELFTGGAKLVQVAGEAGKVSVPALETALKAMPSGVFHHNQPAVLSLTQATECGTVYSAAEVRALSNAAKARNLLLHMDGARFANAVAGLGCAPADITWRAGVDILSFGGTKNGAMAAEAVVYFDPKAAAAHMYRQKRAGHVPSKARFVSAQLLALLADGYWLDLAAHANGMARALADGARARGFAPVWPVGANEVFLDLPTDKVRTLRTGGVRFHPFMLPEGEEVYRFVASFATTPADVEALLVLLG